MKVQGPAAPKPQAKAGAKVKVQGPAAPKPQAKAGAMVKVRTLTLLAVMALCPAAQARQQATAPEIGWVGLFNDALLGILENENQLEQLCSSLEQYTAPWYECRAEKMAPKIHVVLLRTAPRDTAPSVGSLLILARPGEGLRAFFVAPGGGAATEFRPDLFDADFGYGPYFHHTFLERRGEWFRLPASPFPRGTWLNGRDLDASPALELLDKGDIVSSPLGDLLVLGIDSGVLRVRPEQEADFWCHVGEPPPREPFREMLIPLPDLYSPSGNLLLHRKYTRGC